MTEYLHQKEDQGNRGERRSQVILDTVLFGVVELCLEQSGVVRDWSRNSTMPTSHAMRLIRKISSDTS